jgi:hypothetical protein
MASSPQRPSKRDENEEIVLERLKTAEREPRRGDDALDEIVRRRKQQPTPRN